MNFPGFKGKLEDATGGGGLNELSCFNMSKRFHEEWNIQNCSGDMIEANKQFLDFFPYCGKNYTPTAYEVGASLIIPRRNNDNRRRIIPITNDNLIGTPTGEEWFEKDSHDNKWKIYQYGSFLTIIKFHCYTSLKMKTIQKIYIVGMM